MTMLPPRSRSAAWKTARILVVEDERIVARDLQEKLEGMGYGVPWLATSGKDAVDLAERERPDLVLMDINLDGEMDGVEAAGVIRERQMIPVVYLTAYSNQEVVERAKVTEPQGYILKPFQDRELQVVIEMALYRHRMEANLLERERLLAATLRSIGDGVIATDAEGRVTFLNPVAERLTGWDLAEAMGRPVREVFTVECEKTGGPAAQPLDRALQEQAPVQLESRTALVTRDDRRMPVGDSAAPILGHAGALLGGVIVFRDVTAEREAARATERLAALVSSSEDAIIGETAEGMITAWNPGAERLYGYAAGEAVGRHITMLAPPEKVQEEQDILARVRRGEPVPAYETIRRAKCGRGVAVIVTVSPLKDEAGGAVGATVIARDVTHLRRLEEQYRQAQKMEAIGRLAGGVAHDFNNLLTVINGYTNVILGGLHPHDRNREMLEQVASAGERAATLTAQLLAYSRKSILQPKEVDLNGLLIGTEKMLRRIIGEDIELRVLQGEGLPRIKVDSALLEQAVMNMAVNARDAMPQGGKITLETKATHLAEDGIPAQSGLKPGPYAVLRVEDTGCGMDQATLSHIFEPFFTTKEQGKGTGLGLAMVYGTVKQSGGHIEAESLPGRGTTFTIYLPGLEESRPEDSKPARGGLPGGTETVLLVEDEEGVRKLTAHLLKQGGYAVLEAADGAEALEVVAHHKGRIHLVVSDVVMPRMSGPQMVEAVRAVHPGVKVLFQSGYADDALLRHGIVEGERDFIQKPFTLGTLARKVREVLDGAG